jgi:hypothetical protein
MLLIAKMDSLSNINSIFLLIKIGHFFDLYKLEVIRELFSTFINLSTQIINQYPILKIAKVNFIPSKREDEYCKTNYPD